MDCPHIKCIKDIALVLELKYALYMESLCIELELEGCLYSIVFADNCIALSNQATSLLYHATILHQYAYHI